MKDTSEISYLHLDPEETQFKKTLSNINHIQDNQNNSQLINIEQLPNFYSKSSKFFYYPLEFFYYNSVSIR